VRNEIAFVIPVFNEELVLGKIVKDLDDNFEDKSHVFYLINDCSTDSTSKVLLDLSDTYPIKTIFNPINLGHGRSLLKGLLEASRNSPQYVIALDGDGHFTGIEIKKLYNLMLTNPEVQVIEGIRMGRKENFFRKPVSLITRFIVLAKSGKTSKDANTPLRIYKASVLNDILCRISNESIVPNLHIAIVTRKMNLTLSSQRVTWQNIKGKDMSSTWKQQRNFIPPRKFIAFCISAIKEFI
jgi:dolichol-phosphate mannosyltransferase